MCDSASDVCAINRLQARSSALPPTGDRRKTAKTNEERLNRTRERNRNAQRRYREKQKEQIDSLELQIENLGARKAQAIAVRDQLQAERHAFLDRLVSNSPNIPPSQRCRSIGIATTSRAPGPALAQLGSPIATSKVAPSRQLRPAAHSPSDTLPAPPPPTKHGSLVRTRHTSADLYARRSPLPPPISSFRHHATLSYEDFRAASGSRSRVIDLSSMGFQDVVQAAQSATAQRLGYNQADVCWFMQYQYEVEPGVPLSFSTCLSSPECVASLVLGTVIAQLEAAVLGSTGESMHHFSTGGPASATPLSPGAPTAPSADSAGQAEPTSKRMCREAPHACTSSAAIAHSADADHVHKVNAYDRDPLKYGGPDLMHDGDAFACDGGPQDEKPCIQRSEEWLDGLFDDADLPCVGDAMGGRSDACMDSPPAGDDEPDATPSGETFFVRAGLRGLFNGRMAVRAVMLQAVRSMAQHSTASVDTILSLITACWHTVNETVVKYDTWACDCATRAGASAGESGGPQCSAVAGGAATDRPAHPAAQDVAASDGGGGLDAGSKGSGDAFSLLPADSGGSAGIGVDAEQFARQCSVSGHADGGAGGESAMTAASGGPGLGEGAGSKARGGDVGVGGTIDADEEAKSEAYHMNVTHTLCDVLRVIRDMCTEVCDAWRAGRIEALIGPLPAAASEERRREQVFITLTDLSAGHALTVHGAGRVMRAMATNSNAMYLRQYEMENAHVKLYQDLRLSADQRANMAAWWHSWLRQKCGIDASASAARSILDSLPDTFPLPHSHLSHISRVADGLAPPRTCAACAGRHHRDAEGTCRHDSNMHEFDACSAEERSSVAVYTGGGAPGVCGGCGGPADEDAVAGPLGCDAGSTCRAAEAVRMLVRMHDADGALSARALPMHQQPGELLDAEQLAWVCRKSLWDGWPAIDNLVLCQLAATQLRRQELYRWPALLGKPLPERI